MKIFVTGVNGQLGHDVMHELSRRGHEGIGSDIQEHSSHPYSTEAGTMESSFPDIHYIPMDITVV